MKAFLLFLTAFSTLAGQVRCVDSAKIKTIIGGQEKIETVAYCMADNGLYFLGKKCYQTKSCRALEATKKKIDTKSIFNPIGTIPFKVCQIAGGRAHLAKFWSRGNWHSIGICAFGDGSFIGTEHLYKEIMMRRKR